MRVANLMIIFLAFMAFFLALKHSGHVSEYSPHAGTFLRAELRDVQIALATSGFYSAVYSYAHWSGDTPGGRPDPGAVLRGVVDSMSFKACVRAHHESGEWEVGSCSPMLGLTERYSVKLPDSSTLEIEVTVLRSAPTGG